MSYYTNANPSKWQPSQTDEEMNDPALWGTDTVDNSPWVPPPPRPGRREVKKDTDCFFLTGEAARKWEEEEREKKAREYAKFDYRGSLKRSEEVAAAKWAQYPAITKMVYEEHPAVAAMSPAEVANFREINNGIKVQVPAGVKKCDGLPIPNPIPQFDYAFTNFPQIQAQLMETGFEKPSPIQAQAWPLIMQGRDVIGIAQTGSGKTLAFLLPAYAHIMRQPKQKRVPGAHVLVLAPTRELAVQIHQEVGKFNFQGMKSVVIYGGVDRKQQIAEVRRGCNVIIATPGRLDDLVSAGHIDITSVTYVVLDEADRMLDAGFEAVIRKTMYKVRPDRQTIMTSATWPTVVQMLATSFMVNPIQVVVGTLDLSAVTTINQTFVYFERPDQELKFNYLLDLIREYHTIPNLKVMLFTATKARAAYLTSELAMLDIFCACMHGNMDQLDREDSIDKIKSGEVQYLIATDVASRGIDIPNLTHVINFDFPRDIEDYVHRIGRTGRAGKGGKSVTFLTYEDSRHAKELQKILEKAGQEVPKDVTYLINRHEKYMSRVGDSRPNYHSRWNRRT